LNGGETSVTAHLGTLQGDGYLLDGKNREKVRYRIDVTEANGIRHGQGSFKTSLGTATRIMAVPLTLELSNGNTLAIVVDHAVNGDVTFLTSGQIPGF
jgi:exonuclease I